MTIPPREALSGILLLALLCGALLVVPESPGPGPLALVTGLAALHGALLSPLLATGPASFGFLGPVLALPALAATSYGHPAPALWGSILLAAFAAASGSAARALGRERSGLYAPTIVLAFAAPYALRYLVLEFGDAASSDAWLLLSPWAAAHRIAAGAVPPVPAVLALLAWPVWAIARRGR
ncbi:MAG TPA: hypothetical protein VFY93_14245 [Planctomycetota bacterium]|nr:hypothetical protein [Planctomycetota bacterium]